MAILTAMVMKPTWLLWLYWPRNRHGYCDRPGHWNRHGYRNRTGLETDMAIVTALVIETDMAIVTVLASKPIWLLWPPWSSKPTWLSWPYWPRNQHLSFRIWTGYQLQGTCSEVDFLAPVTVAEVVETVTSLLRCFSWAWDTEWHNDPSGQSWNRQYNSDLYESCWKCWGHWLWWLGRNQSCCEPAHIPSDVVSFSSSEFICQRFQCSWNSKEGSLPESGPWVLQP